MRILALSDMHNNVACARKLRAQENNDFDVIAIAAAARL
jgi:predicted phosphodiesterase